MDQRPVGTTPSTSKRVQITQAQFDAYNRRYNNVTYRAFTAKLDQLQSGGYLHTAPPDVYDRVVDLFINASFERVGVEGYAGTESALLELIKSYSQQLVELAQNHLENFNSDPQPNFGEGLHSLNDTAHNLCSQASDLVGFKGRAAFYFLDAACYLLMMACTVYTKPICGESEISYLSEKFRRALKSGLTGLTEVEKGD